MPNQTHHDPSPDAIHVRDLDEDAGDGMYSIRTPISSDQTARDGEAFTTDRLRGFSEQIDSRTVPVFLSHGRSSLSEGRYGALGKIGRVANPDVVEQSGVTTLEADLRIADPDSLAEAGDTGDVEAALRWVREQARRGLISTSVGWSEGDRARDAPGDAELFEVSIVGVPSDPEATQGAPSAAATRGLAEITAADDGAPATTAADRAFGTVIHDGPGPRVRDVAGIHNPNPRLRSNEDGDFDELLDGAEAHVRTLRALANQYATQRDRVPAGRHSRTYHKLGERERRMSKALDTVKYALGLKYAASARSSGIDVLTGGRESQRESLADAVAELREVIPDEKQNRGEAGHTNDVRQALRYLEVLAEGRDPTRITRDDA